MPLHTIRSVVSVLNEFLVAGLSFSVCQLDMKRLAGEKNKIVFSQNDEADSARQTDIEEFEYEPSPPLRSD